MRGLKCVSWGDNTGYAIAAKAYLCALIDAGIDLTWTPMMPGASLYEPQLGREWPSSAKLATVCNKPIEYDTVVLHTVPEYYPDWMERERREQRRIFGYTVWELERLPSHWPDILNRLDGVLVPCRWNADVFRNSGVTVPIHVVPHLSQFENGAVPSAADRARLQARLGDRAAWQNRFVFYTIGFWSHRKAPYLALEAYLQAFDAKDPVALIIKTNSRDVTRWRRDWRSGFRRRHPSPAQDVARRSRQFASPAPVIVIADDSLSDAEMLALHEMGDCFVSLARSEGWGLGLFEAARMGKPVVATAFGGHLDFLDGEFAHLVNCRKVSVDEPAWSSSYEPTQQWAEPSVPHAATCLRAIYDDQSSARGRAQRQADRIAAGFSKDIIVDTLLKALA